VTQSSKRPPRRAPEAHSLSFVLRPLRDGSKRFESILIDTDGKEIPVFLETSQFCPYAGYWVNDEIYADRAPYPGKVIFRWSSAREGGHRLIGYFAPINLEMLDNNEWLPKEQYLAKMRVELTPKFDESKRRLTARHGRLICRFPPRAKVKPGVKAWFLLKEEGNFAWAIPLSEQQAVDETAIVHLAGEAGIISDEELMVVQTAHRDAKTGQRFFRRHNIYALLSDRDNAALKVTALSSREELKKAHNAKVKRTNPDIVCGEYEGGIDAVRMKNPHVVAELESLYAGINLAFKNACELLDRKAKKERPAAKSASVTPTAEEFFGIPAMGAQDDDVAEEQASSPEEDALAGHVDQRIFGADEVLKTARELAGMEVAEFAALDATYKESFIAQAKSLLREADPTATFEKVA